jgi:CubicO group peptidase (beta-lactamase class C family)
MGHRYRQIRSLLDVCVLTLVGSVAAANLSAQAIDAPPPPRGAPVDAAELGAFLDGLMAAHLTDHHVAGATVAVVRDGEILFSKGYGFADADRQVPVDPATTLFRIGSVTKVFTAVAVHQLREQGLVDLDRDVNDYLDFRIPDTYDQPITLRHILTHTPGFEDRVFGLFGETGEMSRGDWLHRNMPARVRPPGSPPSYSNYAFALAGYVVERVSGLPWEEYVETRILEPLNMKYASSREPLPDQLAPHMSGGFAHEQGRFVAKPFERIGAMAPAGSISASARAMAVFMATLLAGGEHGNARVLEQASVRQLLDRALAPDPRVNGMALGLYEKSSHGVRIVGHGGGTQWFFTDMALFAEEKLGIFISYNSQGGALLAIDRFMRTFLDRYYPVPAFTLEAPPAGWAERAAEYEGRYRMLRRSHTTFEKLLTLVMQTTVAAGDNGDIIVQSLTGTERMWEMEPGLFRSTDSFVQAGFIRAESTGSPIVYLSSMPPAPVEKVGVAASPGFHLVLLAFWLLTFLSILAVMPVRYILQRKVAELGPLRGPERWLRWTALAVSVLAFTFLISFLAAVSDIETFLSGETEAALRFALVFPILALVPGVAVMAGALVAYRRRLWGAWGRAYFVMLALAVIVFAAQLHYWNLLGWRI